MNVRGVLFALLVVGSARAQPRDSTGRVHLIRSGVLVFHEGSRAFWDAPQPYAVRPVALLSPAYCFLGKRLYLNLDVPGVTASWPERHASTFSTSTTQAAGMAFGKPHHRLRPFVAVVTKAGFALSKFDVSTPTTARREWIGNLSLEPRLGLCYRLAGSVWLDLTLDAPTGHSLYFLGTHSGEKGVSRVLPYTYDAVLPRTQFGVSYQVW